MSTTLAMFGQFFFYCGHEHEEWVKHIKPLNKLTLDVLSMSHNRQQRTDNHAVRLPGTRMQLRKREQDYGRSSCQESTWERAAQGESAEDVNQRDLIWWALSETRMSSTESMLAHRALKRRSSQPHRRQKFLTERERERMLEAMKR